ncbi:MAG: hypothetical protein EHM73_03650, partial [Chroococcales cyanobacterium metabat2.561]
MSNLIDYSTIQQTIVSNSGQRLVLTTSGQYYYWDNGTQNYSLVDISSFPPGSVLRGIDCDNAGNFYALIYSNISGQTGFYLTSWNSTSQIWAAPVLVQEAFSSGAYTAFSAINDNEVWLVNSDSSIQQYTWNATTQQFDLGYNSFFGAVEIT